MSQYNICNSSNTRSRTLPDKSQDSLLRRKDLGQDPISGILLPTDENIGSRMKTCLSIIDSYDEIMDFIFPPNLSFFMMNRIRVGAWDMFLSQLKDIHWSGFVCWNRWLEKMVGTNGKVGSNPRLVSIVYT